MDNRSRSKDALVSTPSNRKHQYNRAAVWGRKTRQALTGYGQLNLDAALKPSFWARFKAWVFHLFTRRK